MVRVVDRKGQRTLTRQFSLNGLCNVGELDELERLEDVGGGDALVLLRASYFVGAARKGDGDIQLRARSE